MSSSSDSNCAQKCAQRSLPLEAVCGPLRPLDFCAKLSESWPTFTMSVSRVRVADRLASLALAMLLVGLVGLIRQPARETGRPERKVVKAISAHAAHSAVPHFNEVALEEGISRIIADHHRRLDDRQARELARIIIDESLAEGVDPLFVTAVIKAESTFRHSAESGKGAKGLMQLLPSTGRYISEKRQLEWIGGEGLYEPSYNIRLGIAYLKYLEEEFDFNQEEALIAYNWGPANLLAARRRGSSVPSGTRRYASSILSERENWRKNLVVKVASLQQPNSRQQVL